MTTSKHTKPPDRLKTRTDSNSETLLESSGAPWAGYGMQATHIMSNGLQGAMAISKGAGNGILQDASLKGSKIPILRSRICLPPNPRSKFSAMSESAVPRIQCSKNCGMFVLGRPCASQNFGSAYSAILLNIRTKLAEMTVKALPVLASWALQMNLSTPKCMTAIAYVETAREYMC